jgi:hypothetical protein
MTRTDTSNGPVALTVAEAAERLRISSSAAYRQIQAGHIPTVRIGRRLLVPAVWIDRLLEDAVSDWQAV